ncbi:MAG: hypothetical protein WD847_16505 [Pirellulales bacterium]
METSLHRDLKQLYAGGAARVEARHGSYRIDVVAGNELIEIQHGSLAAIRDKVRFLLGNHDVRLVKPIVAGKLLVRRVRKNGPVVARRLSPKRGSLVDLFDELVYFTAVFPHPRLTLEVLLVEIEEWRYPGHGRRRRHRASDFVVEDQKLCRVIASRQFRTAADLCGLIGRPLPKSFHTGHLAEALGVARHVAQRVAYCFRQTGAARTVGKLGNAHLYQLVPPPRLRRGA